MQIWMTLILAVQLMSALAMIGLVLIQHGKGADMGASFGSGASGSLFGATGSANFLSRATAVCATVFFVCTLGLTYLGSSSAAKREGGTSVLDRPAAAASAPTTGVIPGAAPGASPASGAAAAASAVAVQAGVPVAAASGAVAAAASAAAMPAPSASR